MSAIDHGDSPLVVGLVASSEEMYVSRVRYQLEVTHPDLLVNSIYPHTIDRGRLPGTQVDLANALAALGVAVLLVGFSPSSGQTTFLGNLVVADDVGPHTDADRRWRRELWAELSAQQRSSVRTAVGPIYVAGGEAAPDPRRQ